MRDPPAAGAAHPTALTPTAGTDLIPTTHMDFRPRV